MQDITLRLNIGQINLLLEALGSQPYLRVYELIEVLQRQAQAQLGEMEPAGNPTADESRAGTPVQATTQS